MPSRIARAAILATRPERHRRLRTTSTAVPVAVLETGGWGMTSEGARNAFAAVRAKFSEAGIERRGRADDPEMEEVEQRIADALAITRRINTWEGRWPLNTYADRDASKLSGALTRAAGRGGDAHAERLPRGRGVAERGSRRVRPGCRARRCRRRARRDERRARRSGLHRGIRV